jgi:FkbM family methyltransferase
MNLETVNEKFCKLWFKHNGNHTHAVNYPLDENSMVIDLGGYLGKWADVLIKRYNPYMTLVEPIPKFYNELVNKFKNNSKITVLNYAISSTNKKGQLFLNGDATSEYQVNNKPIDVDFITIGELLEKIGREKIELMQINIEGEEFNLLNNMMDSDIISRFDNLQVQFHTFIDDAAEKRENIQKRLGENNFNKLYDYPFIFEGWSLQK